MHNTLSNICCVGGIRCCVGGLPYTTHFQIYNVCFVGSSRCVRDFTIRNTLSNNVVLEVKHVVLDTTHFQNMLCVITFYNRYVGCTYV